MKRPLGLACLFFVLFIRFFYICFPPEIPDYSGLKGREVYVRGRISSIQLQEFGDSVRTMYVLEQVHLQEKNTLNDSYNSDKIYLHDSIRCYSSQNDLQLQIGSMVWMKGRFMPFDGAENPGQFDVRFYFHVQGIGGSLEDTELIWTEESVSSLWNWIAALKQMLLKKADTYFEPPYAGVVKTILLGDKSDLDSDLKALYQESGILHILTISGMHISMLGMGSYKLLRKLRCPMQLSAVIGFILVIFYGALVGTQTATFRAIVMFSMQMAAILLGRTYDRLTGLSVAAILLLLEQPLYVFYSGFLLSFGAVLGITVVVPVIEDFSRDKSAIVKALIKYFAGSIAILITTLPVQLYFYYEYPLYSMIINALLLPFLPYIVAFGVTVLFVPLQLSMLAGLFAGGCQWILYGYEWVCAQIRRLPCHALVIGAPGAWQIVLYYVCMLILLDCLSGKVLIKLCIAWHPRFKSRAEESVMLAAGVSLCFYLCAAGVLLWRPTPEFSSQFLSVGQGDCTLIRHEKEVYLVDGGSSSNLKTAEEIILPCLKYYGISKVDGVFISHADADHMNGILQWLENYEHSHVKLGRIILPALSEKALEEEFGELLSLAAAWDIPVSALGEGDALRLEDLRIYVLYPDKGHSDTKDSNGYSQVLFLEYSGLGILMTGDIGSEQEKEILREVERDSELSNEFKALDELVLKAPHHGSKYSCSEQFLQFLKPEYTVISYGLGNSYGHPHGETLERLEKIGTEVYRTARSGMVTVRVEEGEVMLEEYVK